jgi:DNA-binding CsgD family transcriptional regulator
MIRLDQGNWAAAEQEAETLCAWTSIAEVYRFPALIALARARLRRGDPDADAPLAAARALSILMEELQRSIYIAVLDAERIWLQPAAERTAKQAAIAQLHSAYALARERQVSWVAEEAALWLACLGESITDSPDLAPLYQDHCTGRWQEAAAGWHILGRPYEEAIALSELDEDSQHRALGTFDRLGAHPAAMRLRQRLRASGARGVPRGPLAATLSNPAGLTRRQAQVLDLLAEHLSNAEIADRLCISAKMAEHHVGAVMARLSASSRHEAVAAARERGLLGASKDRGTERKT